MLLNHYSTTHFWLKDQAMMQEDRPTVTPPVRSKKRRILWWLGGGAGLLILLPLLIVTAIIVREGRRAVLEYEKVQGRGLEQRFLEMVRASGTPTSAQTRSTSTLAFAPLIADAPDLPDRLRRMREELNRKYDGILHRIAEYEQKKEQYAYAQGRQIIDEIVRKSVELFGRTFEKNVLYELDLSQESKASGEIYLKLVRLYRWYSDARINLYAHDGNWHIAGWLGEGYLSDLRQDWMRGKGKQQVFASEYFRERGLDEHYRIIYHYWKSKNLEGYAKILELVVNRKIEALQDRLKRPANGK